MFLLRSQPGAANAKWQITCTLTKRLIRIEFFPLAEVAELADALRSGRSGCKAVWVQLPASAHRESRRSPGFLFTPRACAGWGVMYDRRQEIHVTQSPKGGAKTPARPPLTLLQVLVIIGLVAGLLIMLDFNRRQAEAQRLEADRSVAATEVAQLDTEHSALQTQVAYATTDAAVVEWAHEQGKLTQNNEVLVVPLLPTPVPSPAAPPPRAPPPRPDWVLWWDLFLDVPPPASS